MLQQANALNTNMYSFVTETYPAGMYFLQIINSNGEAITLKVSKID